MQCKRDFFSFCNFFSSKRKNHRTSGRVLALYIQNFCKIWVSRNISMFRRVRSTCRSTYYMHTDGTKIENIRHKIHDFSCILAMSHHNQKVAKMAIFSKICFFLEKVQKKSSRMSPIAYPNSLWLFF